MNNIKLLKEKYPEGTKIILTVSKGKEKIALPDVDDLIGLKYTEVEERLTLIGFACEKTKMETSNVALDGTVVSINAIGKSDKNDMYDKGTRVIVSVYIYNGTPVLDENGEPVTDLNGNIIYRDENEPATEDSPFTDEPITEEYIPEEF